MRIEDAKKRKLIKEFKRDIGITRELLLAEQHLHNAIKLMEER